MSTADSLHPSSPPGSRDDLDSEPLFSDSSSDESYHEAARRAADAFAASSTPPSSPEPPLPPSPAILPLEDVFPATPSVFVSSPEEAFSPQLFEFCLQKPIVVVRNLNNVCSVDLSLYSTKKLVQCHPSHPVEMRTQMEQMSNENWDPTMTKQVWYCTSSRSYTTISKYAEYQSANFAEACQNNQTKSVNPDNDFSDKTTRRMIKFGTNCDLSDEKKWAPQLQELLKLPAWLRVSSAGNMLSHVGYQILGMNTVQLYMKVPCARTPGHQENNNFCGVNINIGPGDCEWFGVPNEHWEKIKSLCEKNKLNYLHGSWWPHIKDLVAAKVPTYRFLQKPGDLVWVNAGCVHWVQATGWCNNIAWNVGPLTPRQYNLAMERYEWNKSQRFQSVVAMTSLSWNLARNILVHDQHLSQAIKATLQKSLEDIGDTLELCRRRGVRIRFHGRRKTEACNYCGVCNEEVFNLLFVREEEKIPTVFCARCAQREESALRGFVCLEEFPLEELYAVCDNFGGKQTEVSSKLNGL